MKPARSVQPGWTYNPSSWLRRTPIIALGRVGFFFAGLMAAYQLGYVDSLWDPFFGNGTEEILNSDNQQGDSHEHHRHASGLHE